MPVISSVHWDESTGVCTKHQIMLLPCPECMADQDEDVEVRLTSTDQSVLEFDLDATVEDLLPNEHAFWLIHRFRK